MLLKKILIQYRSNFVKLVLNSICKQFRLLQIQKHAILKSLSFYLPLKLLKLYIQLVSIWYKIVSYHCKFQQNLFETITFLKEIQIYLRCLFLKTTILIDLIIGIILKKLKRYRLLEIIIKPSVKATHWI